MDRPLFTTILITMINNNNHTVLYNLRANLMMSPYFKCDKTLSRYNHIINNLSREYLWLIEVSFSSPGQHQTKVSPQFSFAFFFFLSRLMHWQNISFNTSIIDQLYGCLPVIVDCLNESMKVFSFPLQSQQTSIYWNDNNKNSHMNI